MPKFDWSRLTKLIPVAAGIANPALGVAAETILNATERHLQKESEATGKSVDELIEEYGAKWQANIDAADDLRKAGH